MKVPSATIMMAMRTTQKGIRMRFFQLGPAFGCRDPAMLEVVVVRCVNVKVGVYCDCGCK